jgi:hypothetical protein
MNPRTQCGDDQFGDGYENGTDALVPDTQDLSNMAPLVRFSIVTAQL